MLQKKSAENSCDATWQRGEDLPIQTGGTDSGDYKIDIFYTKAVGSIHSRKSLRRHTEGAATKPTGCVHVMCSTLVMMCLRKTIFSLAAAILETMQKVFLLKKGESAKNSAAVDGYKVLIKLVEREGSAKLLYTLDYKQAQSRGAHIVLLQQLFVMMFFHNFEGFT